VDSSGHGRNGTYSGGVTKGVAGAIANDTNTAALFDGSTGLVTIPDSAALRLNGSWSIEFWAKQVSYPNWFAGLISKGPAFNRNGYIIWVDPWGGVWLKRNNAEIGSGAGSIVSTAYHYFVVTYDGTNVRWYVNGALTRTTAASFPGNNDTSNLLLGKGDVYGNNDLDEVALYSTALSAAQVAAHFAAGQ
jgi:hypothetical protein